MTLLQFEPRAELQETLHIEAGCEVASIPVDGQRVSFRSTSAVDLEPLQLHGVR